MKFLNKFKEEDYTLPGKIASRFIDTPLIKMTGQAEPVMKYGEEVSDKEAFIKKDFFENIDRAVHRICRVYHHVRGNSPPDKTDT